MQQQNWYVHRNGEQTGPFTDNEFCQMMADGLIRPNDFVRHDGATDWTIAADFAGRKTPPPLPNNKPKVDRPTLSMEPSPTADQTSEGVAAAPSKKKGRGWFSSSTLFWMLMIVAMVGAAIGEPSSIPYRLAGALNGAIFGGLAGALAAALQYLVQKKMTVIPLSIAAAIGFVIGQSTEHGINFFGDRFYDANVKPAVTRDLMGRKLDEMPIYQALRKADPKEYSKLRSAVARLVASGANGSEIEAYTQQATALFRRKNAQSALAASPDSLHALIIATQDILNYFHDEQLCADYILQGFGSPRLRALVRESAFAALVERNAVMTFETIAVGQRQPTIYQPLSDSDVQLAIQGLSARGWTDEMRASLADPAQLRAMPAKLVCRIQREWLSTLSTLPEPARSRWYREVLGPMLRS